MLSGSIDRTDLSMSALPFGTGTGLSLFVGGLLLGQRSWRRATVSSPFVAGEFETSAVLDETQNTELHFRIRKTSESALITAATDLVAAVEQRTWALTVTVGSTSWAAMTCTRADTEILFDTAHVRGFVATVNVYTTRKPNSSGPL